MATLDFPTSPSVGQFYPTVIVNPGDPQWVFSAEGAWQRIFTAGSVISAFVGISPLVDLQFLAFPTPFDTSALETWTLLTHI